jgi:hypothetical protein
MRASLLTINLVSATAHGATGVVRLGCDRRETAASQRADAWCEPCFVQRRAKRTGILHEPAVALETGRLPSSRLAALPAKEKCKCNRVQSGDDKKTNACDREHLGHGPSLHA